MKHPRARLAKHTEEIIALIEPDIETNAMNTFNGDRYGHVEVVFRTLDTDRPLDDRYCLRWHDLRWPYAVPMLGNLRIHSQMGGRGQDRTTGLRGVYAYETGYYAAETTQPEALYAMSVTLARVQDKLAKLAEIEGEPQTFGQYVNRVCRALGITRMARRRHWERDKYAPEGHYRFLTLGEGQRYIDQQVDAFFESTAPKGAVDDAA